MRASIEKIGRNMANRAAVDWLRNASVEGIDVFIWAERRHAYGWIYRRSNGVLRPCGLFREGGGGEACPDLIPRLTILEYSDRINSVAWIAAEDSNWSSLERIPAQFKPRNIGIPANLREACFTRRAALASGVLTESAFKDFDRKHKMTRKLDRLELSVLRDEKIHMSLHGALRYLIGACDLLSRRQLKHAGDSQ